MTNCQNCGEEIQSEWDYCYKCGTEILRPSRAFIYEQLFELMKLQDNRRQHLDSKAHTYIGLLSIAVTIIVALGWLLIENIIIQQSLILNNISILPVLYILTVLLFTSGVIFAFHAYHIGSPIVKKNPVKCLFCWGEIPGNDDSRLKNILIEKFSIEWVNAAEIKKLNDDNTITLTDGLNSISLVLNDEKTNVFLEINDGRIDKFIAKTKNGTLNIYDEETYDKNTKKVYIGLDEKWLIENSNMGLPLLQKKLIDRLGHIISKNEKYNIRKSNNIIKAYYITIFAIFSLLLLCMTLILSLY